MISELAARLDDLAAQRRVIHYAALAAELQLPGPGRIAKLTEALECLMEQDSAEGRPLRASLVVSRVGEALPARGFFDMAAALGYDMCDPAAFHAGQLAALFAAAR